MGLLENITAKVEEIKAVEKNLPAFVIIHDIRDNSVVYMSQKALDGLGVTLREVIDMGAEYHSRYFNPEDAVDYVPKILGLLQRNNDDETVSFFQQVRTSLHADWTWYLSSTKIYLRDDDNNPVLIITTSIQVDAQHHIAAKAKRILDENLFQKNNSKSFNQLTSQEKEALKLLGSGFSTSDLGQAMQIPEASAKGIQENLHQKLHTKSNYDFTRFAQAFDLID